VRAGGLGELLFEGISTDNPAKVLAGLIPIIAIALLTDLALRGAEAMTSLSRARRAARG
jgi:ABC-type proline/glycine betaine transport system permease subunit